MNETKLTKRDIVFILVPFTDLSDCKLRPAVILAESASDLIVACITSRINKTLLNSNPPAIYIPVEPTPENGLKGQSYVQISKIITLDRYLISTKIGKIESEVMQRINSNLYDFLKV